jgi:hypothetical protein
LGRHIASKDCRFPFAFFDHGGTWTAPIGDIEEEGVLRVALENDSNLDLNFTAAAQEGLILELVVHNVPHDNRSPLPREVLAKRAAENNLQVTKPRRRRNVEADGRTAAEGPKEQLDHSNNQQL